jgi:hypothetical protein
MTPRDGTPIDWSALLKWYLSADTLVADFDFASVTIQSMLSGTAEANLQGAAVLSRITHDAELWLLAHPSPEEWSRKYLWGIVEMFSAIRVLIVRAGGVAPEAVASSFKREVEDACAMVEGAHQVTQRMAIEHISRPT